MLSIAPITMTVMVIFILCGVGCFFKSMLWDLPQRFLQESREDDNSRMRRRQSSAKLDTNGDVPKNYFTTVLRDLPQRVLSALRRIRAKPSSEQAGSSREDIEKIPKPKPTKPKVTTRRTRSLTINGPQHQSTRRTRSSRVTDEDNPDATARLKTLTQWSADAEAGDVDVDVGVPERPANVRSLTSVIVDEVVETLEPKPDSAAGDGNESSSGAMAKVAKQLQQVSGLAKKARKSWTEAPAWDTFDRARSSVNVNPNPPPPPVVTAARERPEKKSTIALRQEAREHLTDKEHASLIIATDMVQQKVHQRALEEERRAEKSKLKKRLQKKKLTLIQEGKYAGNIDEEAAAAFADEAGTASSGPASLVEGAAKEGEKEEATTKKRVRVRVRKSRSLTRSSKPSAVLKKENSVLNRAKERADLTDEQIAAVILADDAAVVEAHKRALRQQERDEKSKLAKRLHKKMTKLNMTKASLEKRRQALLEAKYERAFDKSS